MIINIVTTINGLTHPWDKIYIYQKFMIKIVVSLQVPNISTINNTKLLQTIYAPELVTLAVALHMCYRALTLSLT